MLLQGRAVQAVGQVTAGRAVGQEITNMRGGVNCNLRGELRFPARTGLLGEKIVL